MSLRSTSTWQNCQSRVHSTFERIPKIGSTLHTFLSLYSPTEPAARIPISILLCQDMNMSSSLSSAALPPVVWDWCTIMRGIPVRILLGCLLFFSLPCLPRHRFLSCGSSLPLSLLSLPALLGPFCHLRLLVKILRRAPAFRLWWHFGALGRRDCRDCYWFLLSTCLDKVCFWRWHCKTDKGYKYNLPVEMIVWM